METEKKNKKFLEERDTSPIVHVLHCMYIRVLLLLY